MKLHQLRVGAVRSLEDAQGKAWRTAIHKASVPGPLWLTREGLPGDQVADRQSHGGPDQAVLAYAREHYPRWKAQGIVAEEGAFGENLLLEGVDEGEACLGDIFTLGEARLQITHPRVPCGTLARRLQRPDIVKAVYAQAAGGWYFRVLTEGWVEAGQSLVLEARPHPQWTVGRALHARWKAQENPEEAYAMARVESLSEDWKRRFGRPS